MFTKISKVVLWIGVVACFILSIVFGTTVKGWEFLVMLSGWVATLIIFSAFGMIVEMADNTGKSRKLLEEILMSKNNVSQTNSVPVSTPANSAQPSYDLSSIAADIKANVKPTVKNISYEPWACPKCGHSNSGSYKFCENCDARRPSNVTVQQTNGSAANSSKDFWICPDCGCYNPFSQAKCSSCGTPKP